jgi:hypothetical protein
MDTTADLKMGRLSGLSYNMNNFESIDPHIKTKKRSYHTANHVRNYYLRSQKVNAEDLKNTAPIVKPSEADIDRRILGICVRSDAHRNRFVISPLLVK